MITPQRCSGSAILPNTGLIMPATKMPFHITQAISIFYKEVSPDDDTEDVDPLTCKCILTIFIKEFAWNCVAFDTNNNMSC